MENKLKLCCVSDLHGQLISTPPCDLLFIAGDSEPLYCHDINFQKMWLYNDFSNWLFKQPAKEIVLISGNHSLYAQTVSKLDFKWKNVHYLRNSSVNLFGLNIWGSPHTVRFYNWAFNSTEEELSLIYKDIPLNTDIILNHGPPYGTFDWCPAHGRKNEEPDEVEDLDGYLRRGYIHQGSKALAEAVKVIRPRCVISGHLHSNYGYKEKDSIIYVAASLLDESYTICREPLIFNLPMP